MEAVNNTKFSLQLYELIRSRTDEETAKKAVEAVEGIVEQKAEQKLSGVALKEDIYALKQDLAELKSDILKEIAANNRWLIGIIFALALMILGLYFKH